jgi:hypothetical protein
MTDRNMLSETIPPRGAFEEHFRTTLVLIPYMTWRNQPPLSDFDRAGISVPQSFSSCLADLPLLAAQNFEAARNRHSVLFLGCAHVPQMCQTKCERKKKKQHARTLPAHLRIVNIHQG